MIYKVKRFSSDSAGNIVGNTAEVNKFAIDMKGFQILLAKDNQMTLQSKINN